MAVTIKLEPVGSEMTLTPINIQDMSSRFAPSEAVNSPLSKY